ncbi:MAG: VCBS repeat-containing protein, partial [Verrucomicrobia bacterium]|nr:VCBS repeat-containing protein [Verrucomicrobiota bacterium]
ASLAFLNRGDHFDVVVLPPAAQWAPVFGIATGDLDGDGNEDLILSQNFFAVRPEDNRLDAGRALWLKGDGQGGLQPVPAERSGIAVYGEQRGCAVSDFDGDGRLDLVISQNGDQTKVYHNVGARPGLRVRLEGPPGNPQGVGAALRLVWNQRRGPLREVQAGSGYWSQNSAVQLLGASTPPTGIWIRWPGGRVISAPIPAGAREIAVNPQGQVRRLR